VGTESKRSADGASTSVWYSEGLRFECQPDCGACCIDHEDYAYVYLERDDIERLAEFLKLTRKEFLERHTTLDDGFRVLKMDQPDCPFLEGTCCSVHPARPTQCRTFPFWEENLTSRAAWKKLCGFCPGIDKGEVHDSEWIVGQRDERRLADLNLVRGVDS